MECSPKFYKEALKPKSKEPLWEKRKRRFIEIDMLTLETNYAKNLATTSELKLGQKKNTLRRFDRIPPKERISEFINHYKLKTH
jgi:hypothetical protein